MITWFIIRMLLSLFFGYWWLSLCLSSLICIVRQWGKFPSTCAIFIYYDFNSHAYGQGESDSELESNGGTGPSQKPQKRARVTKGSEAPPVLDLLQSQPAASNYGCLSLLKKRRSGRKISPPDSLSLYACMDIVAYYICIHRSFFSFNG